MARSRSRSVLRKRHRLSHRRSSHRRSSRSSRSRSRNVIPRSAVQKGALERYDYSLTGSTESRRRALAKAARVEPCKHKPCTEKNSGVHRVIKQVTALVTWNKNRPSLLARAKADLKYVQGLLAKKKKSRSRSRRSSRRRSPSRR